MGRRRRLFNFGNVSVGSSESPTPLKPEDALADESAKSELDEKVRKYREENPEKPPDRSPLIQTPLALKRNTVSFDDEYVEIAKRYLGIKANIRPSLSDLAKGVIRLFEDNVRMYKMVQKLTKSANGLPTAPKGSWEDGSSWN